jgi:hypothetical protein
MRVGQLLGRVEQHEADEGVLQQLRTVGHGKQLGVRGLKKMLEGDSAEVLAQKGRRADIQLGGEGGGGGRARQQGQVARPDAIISKQLGKLRCGNDARKSEGDSGRRNCLVSRGPSRMVSKSR